MTNYRALQNKVNRGIKAEQKLYYESHILDNNGNRNGMWKVLHHLLNQKKCEVPSHVSPDMFNEFFVSIGKKLCKAQDTRLTE